MGWYSGRPRTPGPSLICLVMAASLQISSSAGKACSLIQASSKPSSSASTISWRSSSHASQVSRVGRSPFENSPNSTAPSSSRVPQYCRPERAPRQARRAASSRGARGGVDWYGQVRTEYVLEEIRDQILEQFMDNSADIHLSLSEPLLASLDRLARQRGMRRAHLL